MSELVRTAAAVEQALAVASTAARTAAHPASSSVAAPAAPEPTSPAPDHLADAVRLLHLLAVDLQAAAAPRGH